MKNIKKHSKTRKNNGVNKARGPNSYLNKSVRLPPIKKSRTINKQTYSKRVQINTHENELYEYSLGTSERDYKKASPSLKYYPKCNKNIVFPCRIKRTIFNSKKDIEKYLELKRTMNETTGYKSKEQHYDDIESMLMWKGSELLRK